MPRISINEIDNTTYSINSLTNDNIVYVPGNMPKGEWKNPVLVTSIDEFESEFGNYSPNGKYGKTYEYVKGLLLAGLPVLFRRIVGINQDTIDNEGNVELKIKYAHAPVMSTKYEDAPIITISAVEITDATDTDAKVKLTVSATQDWTGNANVSFKNSGNIIGIEEVELNLVANNSSDVEINTQNAAIVEVLKSKFDAKETLSVDDLTIVGKQNRIDTPQFEIEELTGGSWGNNVKVVIEPVASAVYLSVVYNNREIERTRIIDNMDELDEASIKTLELEFLKSHIFNTIKIKDLNETETFELPMGTYQLTEGEDISDEDVAKGIANTYNFIVDKYIYDVKFITAGGYADTSMTSPKIAEAEVTLANTRKDCFAIIDFPKGTIKTEVTKWFTQDVFDTSYAAAFAPWCYIKLPSGNTDWMAPSYLFMYTLGLSVKAGNPVYSAPAGVLKASMPQVIKPEYEIGGDLLDYWQGSNPQSINPLMKLRNYGYVIYGQKTLYNIQNKNQKTASALQQINVRLSINEVRRILFDAAIKLTFQANNQKTWNEFKSIVTPKLDAMISNGGITDYLIKMDETTTTPEDIQNNTIRAKVKVSVTKAIENFEIDFYVEPQSITFADDENEKNVMVNYESK